MSVEVVAEWMDDANSSVQPNNPGNRQDVADETRHELAFENHRWTDLIRTGKAIEVISAHALRMKALYPWLIPQAFSDITEKRLLYPIPFREIQINSKLEQNPGY